MLPGATRGPFACCILNCICFCFASDFRRGRRLVRAVATVRNLANATVRPRSGKTIVAFIETMRVEFLTSTKVSACAGNALLRVGEHSVMP
jgi:hypothetical protein